MDVGEGEEERLEVGRDGVVADFPELEEEFDGFVAGWRRGSKKSSERADSK